MKFYHKIIFILLSCMSIKYTVGSSKSYEVRPFGFNECSALLSGYFFNSDKFPESIKPEKLRTVVNEMDIDPSTQSFYHDLIKRAEEEDGPISRLAYYYIEGTKFVEVLEKSFPKIEELLIQRSEQLRKKQRQDAFESRQKSELKKAIYQGVLYLTPFAPLMMVAAIANELPPGPLQNTLGVGAVTLGSAYLIFHATRALKSVFSEIFFKKNFEEHYTLEVVPVTPHDYDLESVTTNLTNILKKNEPSEIVLRASSKTEGYYEEYLITIGRKRDATLTPYLFIVKLSK